MVMAVSDGCCRILTDQLMVMDSQRQNDDRLSSGVTIR
jgi:hypothetical protein